MPILRMEKSVMSYRSSRGPSQAPLPLLIYSQVSGRERKSSLGTHKIYFLKSLLWAKMQHHQCPLVENFQILKIK